MLPTSSSTFSPRGLLVPLAACAISMAAGLMILWIVGHSPATVIQTIFAKVIWPPTQELRLSRWSDALQRTTPILLTGLAVALAFRAKVLNIGAEGQFLAGAIAAVVVGLHHSGPVSLPLLLCAAVIGGAIVGLLAGILHQFRQVPIVLSTLLLNFILIEFLRYLVQGPLREPDAGAQPRTATIADSAFLPLIPGTPLHIGFFIALGLALIYSISLKFTTAGFRLRVVGQNPTAARFAGINVPVVALATLAASGGLAGLAGGIELAGVNHRLMISDAIGGFGFTGIAVALLGRLRADGVVLAALFLGILSASCRALEIELQLPFVMAQALQGMVILMMLALTHLKPSRS